MGQLVGCIRGIAEACKALDFPVVSGNVSLYNETNGRAILPTPTIGGVGVIDDFTKSATIAFKAADEAILLIGETAGLARPVALSARDLRARGGRAAAGRSRRRAPQRRSRARADPRGLATAVHDVSDGGLLVALAEMAMASGIGAELERAAASPRTPSGSARTRRRYVLTVQAGCGRGDHGARARRRRPVAPARH